MAYFGGIANADSAYDWQYSTEAQPNLDGREVFWPRGKILGGSSAVNGVRPLDPPLERLLLLLGLR